MLTYKCTSRPALSPWLSQPICSSPPSPLRAAMCPRRLRMSQNSPRVIQQHINLLKPQPFQKGRRQSNFGAVVRGATSYHSLKCAIQALLTQMTCSMKDGPVHFPFSLHLSPFLHLSLMSGCSLKKPFSVFVCYSISVPTHWPLRERREWRRSPSLAQRSSWSGID